MMFTVSLTKTALNAHFFYLKGENCRNVIFYSCGIAHTRHIKGC